MRKAVFITIITLLYALHTHAQFNDTTHYHTAYTSSGSINKTKDGTAYLLNNGLRLGIRKKTVAMNFTNTCVYGRQQDALTNNDFSTSFDFNLYKTFPKFNYWGLANYNTSYSLKINNQLLTGLGVAYTFIDNKAAYLNLSNGVLYDKSDLFLNDTTRDVYHTFRNSFRLLFRVTVKDILTLESSNFLQNSFDYGNDYIIRSNSTLSFKINQWLSLTTALSYNRLNRTRSDNLLLTYGLTFDRYF